MLKIKNKYNTDTEEMFDSFNKLIKEHSDIIPKEIATCCEEFVSSIDKYITLANECPNETGKNLMYLSLSLITSMGVDAVDKFSKKFEKNDDLSKLISMLEKLNELIKDE